MTGRAWFEPSALAAFWRFVAERQAVWYRRVVLGEDPPWTADAALRRHRFTNVYRRLDPGTVYAVREILERDAPAADRFFNVLIYRLVGRAATHDHVGFRRLDDYDVAAFERALRDRGEHGPVFTGAYVVAGYAGMGGDDKVANVARLFGLVRDRLDGGFGSIADAEGPRAAFEAIRSLPGFGDFLTYQVLVDCGYPLDREGGDPLLACGSAGWAKAGPGARRGLDDLLVDGAEAGEPEVMRWLRRHQAEAFGRLDRPFRWLRDPEGEPVALSLADVQNCLCEFHKHRKVTRGTGRARRRFRPDGRRPTAVLRERYAEEPVSLEPSHYDGGPD